MWHFFLAAAVAGSGIFARHLFFNPHRHSITYPDSERTRNRRFRLKSTKPNDSDLSTSHQCDESAPDSSSTDRGGVFRFSTQNPTDQGDFPSDIKCKKISNRKSKKIGAQKLQKKFAVLVKRRRIDQRAVTDCSSCSSNRDTSLFRVGFGFGMMFMSSAKKAETVTLNASISDLKIAIEELQSVMQKRKISADIHSSSSIKGSAFLRGDDGECSSSVLTDEPAPATVEMNHLHAELESELQKLPGCLTEEYSSSKSEEGGCFNGGDEEAGAVPSGFGGVPPFELETRLFHVLIQQQETQIEGLESQLQAAHSKLHERETELLALKDCVRRLTAFTLSNTSDDESECNIEQGMKKSVLGMKRPIESTS